MPNQTCVVPGRAAHLARAGLTRLLFRNVGCLTILLVRLVCFFLAWFSTAPSACGLRASSCAVLIIHSALRLCSELSHRSVGLAPFSFGLTHLTPVPFLLPSSLVSSLLPLFCSNHRRALLLLRSVRPVARLRAAPGAPRRAIRRGLGQFGSISGALRASEEEARSPVPFSERFPKADPAAFKLLQRLLACDPKDRPTAEEVKENHRASQ